MNIQQIRNLDDERRYQFALVSCILAVFLVLFFIIIDFIEGDVFEMISEMVVEIVLIISLLLRNRLSNRLILYRLVLYTIGLFFLVNVAAGSGNETVLYWVMVLPLFTFSLMGRKEGFRFSIVIFSLITIIIIFPSLFNSYRYDLSNTIRFIGAYLFILLFTYQFESRRGDYFDKLIQTTHSLNLKKEKLEKSIKEIKTLSGLLPICASCKKIRDDNGYWKHVENYIAEHSDAVFTHGICPECKKQFSADFKNKK